MGVPLAEGIGSPPRAWGQYGRGSQRAEGHRFTPTGVGTITATYGHHAAPTVHPHGRGDNRRHAARPVTALWFTPTGVGTMFPRTPHQSSISVHPHGRGDNPDITSLTLTPPGSPPRAWGQLDDIAVALQYQRFTPTGVGTMGDAAGGRCHNTVHPHGRGDNLTHPNGGKVTNGSPPRAWGQFNAAPGMDERRRFTPTGVGTISGSRTDRLDATGSPPRAWGQSVVEAPRQRRYRFTPTGVGTILASQAF